MLRSVIKFPQLNRIVSKYPRSLSTVPKVSPQLETYNVGDQVNGFRVEKVTPIPDFSIQAIELVHNKTNSRHLHLSRNDSNNCFFVNFRTTPSDSTGVAHILEHLVLCGSSKYPVRDPFMKMTSRSLATFMNAMTWPDCTMYPFSSTNNKDFLNLMDVYLDAVFFPKLRYLDFIQEGWRMEFEDASSTQSPLKLKGVVFNEMKGAFSSTSSVFYRSLLNELFNGGTYQHESGGDPLHIPRLTYDNLSNFYKCHYHPSNARFYTYGDFSLKETLSKTNQVLEQFEDQPSFRTSSFVPPEPKWTQSRRLDITCQPDSFAPFPDKQTTVSVSVCLETLDDPYECSLLSLLAHLLTDGPNSPFYQALITSGMGNDYSPGSGYSGYTKQGFFSIGLQGIRKEDAPKVEDIIRSTLNQVAIKGIDPKRIESVLNLVEISMKHSTSNYGLHLAMTLNPFLNHDADYASALEVTKFLDRLKKEMDNDSQYLQKKVKHHLIENPHQLVLSMSPDDEYLRKNEKIEQDLLAEKVASLTESDRKKILSDQLELASHQKSEEDDTNILPTLNVNQDISRDFHGYDLEFHDLSAVKVQTSAQPTNGINYIKMLFKLPDDLSPSLTPYLPLFTSLITHISAGDRTHKEMDQEITLRTKGLSASIHLNEDPDTIHNFSSSVLMSTYCLEKNFDHMLNLWREIITRPKFGADTDHLIQLIRMTAADVTDGISHAGNAYASGAAASGLTASAAFKEQISGLVFADLLKQKAESPDVTDLITKMELIRDIVFKRNNLKIMLNAEGSSLEKALKQTDQFIGSIPTGDIINRPRPIFTPKAIKDHHILNFNTNYCGKAVTSVPFFNTLYPSLVLAGKIASSKYLLREVREIGGAYGARAAMGSSGIFQFSSYRDPNTLETFEKFEKSARWLADGSFKDKDIDEAKLSTFQSVDAPVAPESRGGMMFLNGITYEQRHEYRLSLLDVNRRGIIEAAQKYLVNRDEGVGYAVLGPENKSLSSSESRWFAGWKGIQH